MFKIIACSFKMNKGNSEYQMSSRTHNSTGGESRFPSDELARKEESITVNHRQKRYAEVRTALTQLKGIEDISDNNRHQNSINMSYINTQFCKVAFPSS